ncbi:ABC transporter ATP-binding protein [Robertkochia solimangrovi]|uniref:ABC transporter ATP-binding protein n=1 Tax=Robertkochia solimangrovi TaxID=2213046 RepID=UPI00117BEA97|nr:ABC transporter ATP-binding protein [Robertkochia solimangrovi]TRZ43656.1 ABC transporter ATP-binding protein [Robertkochia solimangrovi]
MAEKKLSEKILEVENLNTGYRTGKRTVSLHKDLRFELSRGELIAMVGPNGIGKSTLLRTLSGILPPLGGSIYLEDKRISEYTPLALAEKMSLVLTEQIPAKALKVKEVIALGRQPYTNWIGHLSKTDLSIIGRTIEQLGLEEIRELPCYELSDGQFQRVMIGRALAQDTGLIILDEPTTHLDIYHKAYILKLLKRIAHENNKCVLFSSHEIHLVNQLCDKVLVLQKDDYDFDQPCNLIEKGSYQKLFPGDLIDFDSNTGSFRIRN